MRGLALGWNGILMPQYLGSECPLWALQLAVKLDHLLEGFVVVAGFLQTEHAVFFPGDWISD